MSGVSSSVVKASISSEYSDVSISDISVGALSLELRRHDRNLSDENSESVGEVLQDDRLLKGIPGP